LISFFIGQPAVQFLNIITGFLLLRWLDVEQYAMLGITLAFQITINQLADAGFSGSIIALSGERGRDPVVLGAFIRSARYWRFRSQLLVLVLSAIAFPWLTWSQPWPVLTKLLLFTTILLGLLFQGLSLYGAPLLVHRALRPYYTPQIIAALARLALAAAFFATGLLNAWQSALLSVLTTAYTGLRHRALARPYLHEPSVSDPDRNRAVLRYLAPLFPGTIFAILQGQILIALGALFGTSQNIAEVTALGRLSQIFILFGAFVTVFIQPYIASLPRALLLRRYLQILSICTLFWSLVALVGWHYPDPFLWLLGPKYATLGRETSLTLVSGCIAALAGLMWAMHAARGWLFWWGSFTYIATMIMAQIAGLLWLDLSRTDHVIQFGFLTVLAGSLVHLATAVYGFCTQGSLPASTCHTK
jgi:O-antigen/teichoic acid export membrane protein